jgi:nitrogen fixation/metabolism regulation signal transduction histidine kinase
LKQRRLGHEARVALLALAGAAPSLAAALALVWLEAHSSKLRWTLTVLLPLFALAAAVALRERVERALQRISALLSALREGDFTVRARVERSDDALGVAATELNLLGDTLREQRLGALEASALLGKVMAEVDAAVYAFDNHGHLRLTNRAGERLLGEPAARLLGRDAGALGMSALLEGETPRTVELSLPGGAGACELRRGSFRQGGVEHNLVLLTDLARARREQERAAWQRLVRVLGHEINNSLAPIRSVAGTLHKSVSSPTPDPELRDDLLRGLALIERRCDGLGRFLTAYAQLARLPPPRLVPVEVGAWVRRVAELEQRLPVAVEPGAEVTLAGDPDQLDQALINLVRNAVDAARETGGTVRVRWEVTPGAVEVQVIDDGPGLGAGDNLFVPFFTTKPEGSGIGLVLARQIAEAHHGALTLENRDGTRGCVARLRVAR